MRFDLGDKVRYRPHYQQAYPEATWSPEAWVIHEIAIILRRDRRITTFYKVVRASDPHNWHIDCLVREDQLEPWKE